MPYCIYLRKSRADRDNPLWTESEILARHEQTLTELANNRGYKIDKIFREVVSGETLAARPQMQQLLTEVESGLWEGVLVMEVERLARGNSIDQGIVSQAFKYSNTLIITPNKTYNPANEFDEEFFEFGLFMSRREYKTINRRLSAGRLASCKEGKYVGSVAPYGYKRVKLEGQKGYTLDPNPDEAEIIKLIFKWYTQENRIGTRLICKKLDEMGIKTRKGGKWSLPTVRDILKNDIYIGKIHWNKAKQIKTTINGNIIISRPRQTEYDVFQGLHQPLIDIDTFNKAQYYMAKNPANPARGHIANPLAGLIECSVCGRKMIRRPSNIAPDYLICPTPNCSNIGTPLEIVENKVIDGIEIWLNEYAVKSLNSPPDLQIVSNKPLIEQIDKQIAKLNNQLTNTYNLLEEGLYSKDLFLQRQGILTGEINKLQEERENLSNEDNKARQKKELKQQLIPEAQRLLDIYYNLPDAEQKNILLKRIFRKIIYTKEKGGRWDKSALDDFTLEFISILD
ncbi:MAG: recombinase family protein [Clostridia bacterium]|nr:recombinase family protein [Clostridia bacterium]